MCPGSQGRPCQARWWSGDGEAGASHLPPRFHPPSPLQVAWRSTTRAWTSLIINTTTIILISGVAVVSQVYRFKTWMSSSHAQSLREHAPELQSWILCIHDVHIWTSHRDQWRFNWYFDKLGVSTRLPESISGSVVSPWHHHRRPGWTQLANSENTYPDLFPLGWSPSLSPWGQYMVTITIPLKTNLAFVSQIIRQKSSCVEKSGPWMVSVEDTSLQTY